MGVLKLRPDPIPPAAPVDLGELLSPQEIAERFFRGKVRARWVRERFAPFSDRAIVIRSSPHFWEAHVREILPQLGGHA